MPTPASGSPRPPDQGRPGSAQVAGSDAKSEHDSPVDVIAVVTSAGGLDALSRVLGDLPEKLGAAVLVQQHLSGQGSELVSILEQRTGRRVSWATDGGLAVPDEVVVSPPGHRAELRPDRRVSLVANLEGARVRPHDGLLTSLADSIGDRALAVVLTGMGTDGADGTAALVRAGGRVIAQSAESAEQPSMPHASADAGADLVLPLDQIGRAVAELVTGSHPSPREGHLGPA